MQFLFAGDFFAMLARSRMLHISGELGTGKTLLGFACADYLMRHQLAWGVWSNIEHKFPERRDITRTIFELDEGAEFMDARDSATEYQAVGTALRKLRSFVFTPSVNRVDKRAIPLEAWRVYDLDFIKTWVYAYKSASRKEQGWFLLVDPQDMFGLYDTESMPDDDAGMIQAFNEIRPEKTIYKRKIKVIQGA